MNIKPLSDRVVLQAVEKENITAGGIYIPESANKERPFLYQVIAVGPGKSDKPMTLKVGDKVLCGQYAGDEVKFDNNEYKIVGLDYVLAIVE